MTCLHVKQQATNPLSIKTQFRTKLKGNYDNNNESYRNTDGNNNKMALAMVTMSIVTGNNNSGGADSNNINDDRDGNGNNKNHHNGLMVSAAANVKPINNNKPVTAHCIKNSKDKGNARRNTHVITVAVT